MYYVLNFVAINDRLIMNVEHIHEVGSFQLDVKLDLFVAEA